MPTTESGKSLPKKKNNKGNLVDVNDFLRAENRQLAEIHRLKDYYKSYIFIAFGEDGELAVDPEEKELTDFQRIFIAMQLLSQVQNPEKFDT